MFLFELGDVIIRHLLLSVVLIENRGPILSSRIRALAIQLGGIVSDEKKYFQQIVIRDLRRIVSDLDRLGVSRRSRADGFVIRGVCGSSSVSGNNFGHALHMLEDGIHAPETAARKNRSSLVVALGLRQHADRRQTEKNAAGK